MKNEWTRYVICGESRSAHTQCVERFNACMDAGVDHGDCMSPLCAMSAQYDRAASEAAREQRIANKAKAAQ